MSVCPPRIYKTRPVPTALCTTCQTVTPFLCVECLKPTCATCMHQYTGMCAACCELTHGQDQTTLQGRANAYWWAFFDGLMVQG